VTGTLAVRRPRDTTSMEIAPGIPQIVELLGHGPKSVDDLFRTIYPHLDARLGHLARNQILSHLAKLGKEGRVSASGERFTCPNQS
jgi:hypothetical protein